MNTVETTCSNQTHQLMVTVSRHFYISKKGILTYQEKPFAITLSNYQNSKKELLVFYVIIDRFSGNFVFQVATTGQMFPLADFLYYAWRQDKEEDHFWGMPDSIAIAKTVSSPSLFAGLKQIGVNPFNPTPGFPTGGHVMKALEEHLWSIILYSSTLHFRASIEWHKAIIYDLTLGTGHRGDCRLTWQNNQPSGHPKNVPAYQDFISAFKLDDSSKSILPIALTDAATNNAETFLPSAALPRCFTAPLEELHFSEAKLTEANLINDDAWEASDTIKGVKIAYQALELSPFCADALNFLSLYSEYYEEKYFLSKRAVLVGKAALGDLYIKKNTGHFWGILETRPYMRALLGLADCYWHKREFEQAVEIYREMLKLNSSDNQGVRYALGYLLLLLDRRKELDIYFKEHGEEETCFMLYAKALFLYRLGSANADNTLQRAIATNKHVYSYLSGEEAVPYRKPDHYSWGEPSEAICYVSDAKEAWENSPGSIQWLQQNMETFKENMPAAAEKITIEQALQGFLEEQSAHLSKTTYSKYKTVIELLEASMECYSPNNLDRDEKEVFDFHYKRHCDNGYEEENVFCSLFGPEKIVGGAVEFLSYFMPHKVAGSKDHLKTSTTVVKKLGQWLFDQGYIDQDGLYIIKEEAVQAARELPAIDDLEEALFDYLEEVDFDYEWDEADELDDVFEVIAVKPGILTLETFTAKGKIEVEVKVPLTLSKLCRVGWQMGLLLVNTKEGWTIIEVGKVSY